MNKKRKVFVGILLVLVLIVLFAAFSSNSKGGVTGEVVSSSWTAWYDDMNPGDLIPYSETELLSSLRTAHPEICASPTDVECVTVTDNKS